jgi:uncharacterized Zn-binding protein involved in type VI secretion
MPGPLLHVGAQVLCTHGVPATIVPSQPRVLVSGQPVATMASQIMVAGCPFTLPPPKPQPCLTIQWTLPAARVLVSGQPAAIAGPAPGICLSAGIPNGPPTVAVVQPRVIGT